MTRIAENQIAGNRARRLLVLGAAIALIVIALGGHSIAAANSSHPYPEFRNNAGLVR
jgi:hypothetical protein